MWTVILHFFGVEPRSPSTAYNWWSGAGSDLSEFAILAIVYRRLVCHQQRCFRIGLHKAGDHLVVCAKHHPAIPDSGVTTAVVLAAHNATAASTKENQQ